MSVSGHDCLKSLTLAWPPGHGMDHGMAWPMPCPWPCHGHGHGMAMGMALPLTLSLIGIAIDIAIVIVIVIDIDVIVIHMAMGMAIDIVKIIICAGRNIRISVFVRGDYRNNLSTLYDTSK